MESESSIQKGSPIIPTLSRINPISRIKTYFFKVQEGCDANQLLGNINWRPMAGGREDWRRKLGEAMTRFRLYPNID